jgi:membrane peptidoglycan carboxypeptidase
VKFRATKWLKRLALLSIVVFAVYLNYLHSVVKDEFSKPLDLTNSQLSLETCPKSLVNMLLIMEDQSFFNHNKTRDSFTFCVKTHRTHLSAGVNSEYILICHNETFAGL